MLLREYGSRINSRPRGFGFPRRHLRHEMCNSTRGAWQPAAVYDAGAHRDWIERRALPLTELAVQRALDGDRTAERCVRALDTVHAPIALAPHTNERRVHVEPARRDLMYALIDL